MKTASAELLTHMAGEVTSLCTCWMITRRDGTEFFFTDHDADLVVSGDTYIAAIGYTRTAIRTGAGMEVDNADITGIFDDDSIMESEMRSGLFDGAEVRVFLVNWADLTMGVMALKRGRMGDVSLSPSGVFMTQLMGFGQVLQQTIGDIYSPTCRVDLGDDLCGIDLIVGGWQKTATVSAVTSNRVFRLTITEPRAVDGWFVDGVVTFTSGANNGRSMEVKKWTQSTAEVELFIGMQETVSVSNTLTIYPGCLKTVADCRDRYNNILNFRGEPYMPGIDGALQSPKSDTR